MKPWLKEICERVNSRRGNPPQTQQAALDALDVTFASYCSRQCGDLISCLIERCEKLEQVEDAAVHWYSHRCVHGARRLEEAVVQLVCEKARDA